MRPAHLLPAVALALVALFVALLALAGLGTFVPGLGLLSALSTVAMPTLAPDLVIFGLLATAVALLLRRRLPVPGTVVAAAAAAQAPSPSS